MQADIERLSHDGRGIARLDGKVTFIEGALPGERVIFERTRRKKDFDEGRCTTVLSASPDRVTPHCPHFEVCGGCSLQHLSSAAQRLSKQEQLNDLFQRIGKVTPETWLAPLSSKTWHYRHKARLSVRFVEKKQKVLVGFREKKQPRYVVDMQTCPILSEALQPILAALPEYLGTLTHARDIPQIEIAVGDHAIALIVRHLSPFSEEDLISLRDFAIRHGIVLFLQPAGPDSIHLHAPEDAATYLSYALPEYGLDLMFYPTDFTQINPALNRMMIPHALSLLDLTLEDRVLDLFCGLGNFSLPIARLSGAVMGVEGSEAMVLRAAENARKHHITHASFRAADLEDSTVYAELAAFSADKVLIDPPRAGAWAFVQNIDLISPERIVYVSCDPATLARDAGMLVTKGYVLAASGVMDMFPHTTHVESIALFKRR